MNEITTTENNQQPAPAFQRLPGLPNGGNVGAIAIEQERAIAEAQGQLTLAKRFPRSMAGAMQEFLETCQSPDFAKTAFYSVPNRGSGPSIRFAEEAARCYGNFQYGHRELSRHDGKSEIEVFAWDMQNNNYSKRQITVMHVVDTKNGPRKLIDQNDIDNRIANVASKQMRGRILALLPKHLVAAGQEACKRTIAGGGEKPLRERISGMVQAFAKFGVTTKHLSDHLNHSVDDTTLDELADLMGVYNAIREGAKASEYFKQEAQQEAQQVADTATAITNRAKASKTQTTKTAQPTETAEKPQTQKSNEGEAAATTVKATTAEPAPSETTAPASQPSDSQQEQPANGDDDVF